MGHGTYKSSINYLRIGAPLAKNIHLELKPSILKTWEIKHSKEIYTQHYNTLYTTYRMCNVS